MNRGSLTRWLSALGAVMGIAAFTASSPAYADGNGCTMGSTCSLPLGQGTCGFYSDGNDYCVCTGGSVMVKTCSCSTGEYPPCGGS